MAKALGLAGQERERLRRGVSRLIETRFEQQLKFIKDKSTRKAAFTTRRAGKTETVIPYLIATAAESPQNLCVYMTLTRLRAKHLVWRPLMEVNQRFGFGMKTNETELSAMLPGGGEIRLTGAANMQQVDKKRGDKVKLAILDEVQSFPSDLLRSMIEDAIGPGTEDLQGTIAIMGTPGITCSGYWWDATKPKDRQGGWSVHSWSVLDNPHMAHMRARLPKLREERGWTEDHPTYRREYLGEWVADASALFYRFDESRNTHDIENLSGKGWMHVLGWDLGFDDAMAIVVWAFHREKPGLWEAFSWKKPGALVDEVSSVVRRCVSDFNIVSMVADTGGGGKMMVEEVRKRHGLHFKPAEKTAKYQHVELFNSEMATGLIKLRRGSPYAQEMAILPKDEERRAGHHPKEDPRYENHCCDAGLYPWREAKHYLGEAPRKRPAAGTPEAWEEEESQMLSKRESRLIEAQSKAWWEIDS